MKNKQHEYILKAFIESHIPTVVRRNSPELVFLDSVMGGYCKQLMNREKSIELQTREIISKTEKVVFSDLINQSTGIEKDELIIYYRFAIFVEAILLQYQK